MKNKKSLMLVVALLLVGVTGCFVANTYSRYLSKTETVNHNANVAKWVVKVNDTDITGVTKTFTADTINWATSSLVADNKIAPGRTGTFDIVVDPTGAEVAMEYYIEIGDITDGTNAISNDSIKISSVKIGNTVLTKEATGDYAGQYKGTIALNGAAQTVTVTVAWDNAEVNNEADTTVGTSTAKLEIPVTVTARQQV